MVVRRLLLTAGALVLVSAGPASAGHTYNDVLGTGQERPATASGVPDPENGKDPGLLARTGSSSALAMAEAGTVMLAGGALLVVASRRRRSRPSAASA